MRSLFLVDLKAISGDRVQAIKSEAKDSEIYVPYGTIHFNDTNIEFNTFLTEAQSRLLKDLNIVLVTYATVKKDFAKYDNKYLVQSNDTLLTAFVFDLNLEGRSDVHFMNFETRNSDQTLEILQEQIRNLLQQNAALLQELNETKLRVSSILAVLTEDQRKESNLVFEKQKHAISITMQKASQFGEVLQQSPAEVSIQTVLDSLEKKLNIQDLASLIIRNYFKLRQQPEDLEAVSKPLPKDMLAKDKVLFQAVVATLAQ